MTFRKSFASLVVVVSSLAAMSSAWAACDTKHQNQTPNSRYVISGGEAFDKQTNLTWQRCSLGQEWKEQSGCVGGVEQLSWGQANLQASGLWRLPSKDELMTLVSAACKNPSVNDKVFPNMDPENLWYWSSTPYDNTLSQFVNFGSGHLSGVAFRLDLFSVRLVQEPK